MPDGINKTGAAWQFFGRISREMIPVFNQGVEAFEKLKTKGSPFTAEDAEKASQFNVALEELKISSENLWIEIANKILPILQDFAQWMQNWSKQASQAGSVADTVAAAFKVLATAIAASYFAARQLIDFLSGVFAVAFETLSETIGGIVGQFGNLKDILEQIGQILDDLLHARFSKAKDDVAELGEQLKHAALQFADTFAKQWDMVKTGFKLTNSEMADELIGFAKAFQSLWGDKAKTTKGTTAAGAPGAAGAGAGSGSIRSEEAKKLEDEAQKQFQQATMGKLQLLEYERNEMRKKLELEVTDKKQLAADLLLVDQIYEAKKRTILDERADKQRKDNLELVKSQVDAVEKDPDLTTAERKQKLIPLLEQEKTLLREILDIETARSKDKTLNPDERDKAADRAAQTNRALTDVNAQEQKANQTPFDKMLLQLRQQNDLQQEVADNFGRVFNGAIASISNGITGLIEGTQNWNQALKQIGASILNEIISAIVEMGVRWVATQVMMAIFGKTLAAASTATLVPIAAAQAAIWAAPAALSTIASYGESAAQAPELIGIAMGMTQALAFASGGIIPAGERLIRVNENGQEAVLNARALSFLGPDFVHAVNSGLLGASDVGNRLAGSVSRPITSDANAYQQMLMEGAKQSAGGGSGVNVEGHKLTAVFPSSRQETIDFLKSAEGEKILIDTVKRRRVDIGINT
jgi:hypothetical protein